ncbi:hypothetical protein [Patulibacter defluvii]|uniref:hypothetical protein n=1 Tax=Patulibacter defluvii TaxID=3095358 RepID=UPI002A76579E|nr:hypothetical protein [Patulibacter sp. DM4]
MFPLAAALLALGATGCGTSFGKDDPQTAVRDFLGEALAQQNGQRACDYLTQEAQQKIAAAQGVGGACRDSFEKAYLVDDGDIVQDTAAVNDLDYSTQVDGDTATVTVKAGDRELRFELEHSGGLGNLYEPETPWRIVGGAEPLVTGAA